jgi:lipopolysaccharide biosynthesis regulator YciM
VTKDANSRLVLARLYRRRLPLGRPLKLHQALLLEPA